VYASCEHAAQPTHAPTPHRPAGDWLDETGGDIRLTADMKGIALDEIPRPRLVFIHGVTGYKKRKKWLDPLNASLKRLGIEPWDKSEIPKVRYKPSQGPKDSKPSRKSRRAKAPATKKADFEENQEELSRTLAAPGRRRKPGQRPKSRAEKILDQSQRTAANSIRMAFFQRA